MLPVKTMDDQSTKTISELTRRTLIDYLSVGRHWSGALPEDDFLGRIYDLKRMSSTDYRAEYDNAAKDIWKHRVVNSDWPDDWVFTDDRFDLLFGPDEQFLKFLAETVHPVVRRDAEEVQRMVAEYNQLLSLDGWEIYPTRAISGRQIFGYRRLLDGTGPHLEEASKVAEKLSGHYVAQQVRRLREAVEKDPDLAIGTAKEFLETLCKTILTERQVEFATHEDLPFLVRTTIKSVHVVPAGLSNPSHSEKTIVTLLNNLASVSNQLAEIRNQFGTGHGRATHQIGLQRHHARLAVAAATTVAVFLFECHEGDPAARKP